METTMGTTIDDATTEQLVEALRARGHAVVLGDLAPEPPAVRGRAARTGALDANVRECEALLARATALHAASPTDETAHLVEFARGRVGWGKVWVQEAGDGYPLGPIDEFLACAERNRRTIEDGLEAAERARDAAGRADLAASEAEASAPPSDECNGER